MRERERARSLKIFDSSGYSLHVSRTQQYYEKANFFFSKLSLSVRIKQKYETVDDVFQFDPELITKETGCKAQNYYSMNQKFKKSHLAIVYLKKKIFIQF